MNPKADYIPALGHEALTPLYDPLLRWVMREEQFKRYLIQQAQIQSGYRVLDLGCGTATLTIRVKQAHPEAEVVGLDGDAQVLKIGRQKATRAGVAITLDEGMAYQLPYPEASFDRVLSSLVFHHLTHEDKEHALRESWRVLKPAGEIHIVDFGKPYTLWGNSSRRWSGARNAPATISRGGYPICSARRALNPRMRVLQPCAGLHAKFAKMRRRV
jgi:ubiquinone/menaquinone biosynthesis C-methylase UbiE